MRLLVVGAGSIGTRHVRNLLAAGRGLEVTVAEPSGEARAAVRELFEVEVVPTPEAALERGRYQAAVICSPTHLHSSHARLLAASGSHLFVEKPFAMDADEARDLAAALGATGVKVMVACNLRFHAGAKALRDVIRTGRIGRVLYARAQFAHYLPNWRPGRDYRQVYSAKAEEGGGILLDDIHEPDYLCWLLGPASRVSGFLSTLSELEMEVEDVAEYVMWHGERTYSQVHADYLRRDKVRTCELVGTNGTLVWRSVGKNPERVTVEIFDAASDTWETLLEDPTYDTNAPYLDQTRYFLERIEDDREMMNGVSEALHVMEVLQAVRMAAIDGCHRNVRQA